MSLQQNSPVHTKGFVAAMCCRKMLLQLVTSCVPTLKPWPCLFFNCSSFRFLIWILICDSFLSSLNLEDHLDAVLPYPMMASPMERQTKEKTAVLLMVRLNNFSWTGKELPGPLPKFCHSLFASLPQNTLFAPPHFPPPSPTPHKKKCISIVFDLPWDNLITTQWCKSPLPVDVHRSKTLLLKLPIDTL